MRKRAIRDIARISLLVVLCLCGRTAYGQALGHLFADPRPSLMHIAYYPTYEQLQVRINPTGPGPLDEGLLRTPEGEPGLRGEYFANMELEGEPALVRTDPGVHFDWGVGSPHPSIPVDRFSVRWTGTIGPLDAPGRLMTVSDDGVRLWQDGKLVIDDWRNHAPQANTASVPLEPGRVYEIRLEYYEAAGGAMCELHLIQDVTIEEARIRLLDPEGKVMLVERLTLDGGDGVGTYAVGALPEGRYTVEADIDLPGGMVTARQTFTRRHFAWEGNQLGVTNAVFAPFEPVSVEGDQVSVVLRRYRLGGLGLPLSVVAAGNVSAGGPRELLAGPIVLRVNATDVLAGEGGFTGVAEHEAVYEGEAVHPAVTVRTRVVTEYDGCMKVELTLGPGAEKVPLTSLWLDIPMDQDLVPLFHASTTHLRTNPAGKIPDGAGRVWGSDSNRCRWYRWFTTFNAYVWLGAEERGLAWFADNEKNWVLDLENNPACQEILRDGDAVILRVNLVQKPVVLEAERTIVFGLMASPAKPMRADWRTVPIAWMGAQYWGSDHDFAARYPRNADLSVLDMVKSLRLGEPFDFEAFLTEYHERNFQPGMPTVRDWNTLRPLLGWTAGWARGAGTQRPTNAYWEEFYSVNHLHPEVDVFQHEWGGDMVWRGWGNIGGIAPSYRDFAVWWGREFIRRGVGLYFDNAFPKANYDPMTSDAYRLPDGNMQPSAGIWAHRDYLRRIWVLHQTEADPRMPVLMMIHMTNTQILPYMVWNDANLDLEWKDGDEPAQWKYPADLMRAHALGRQTGNIPLALGKIHRHLVQSPEREAIAKRTRTAAFAVHEIAMPSNEMDKRLVDFGYGQPDCAILNYWDAGYPLQSDDPDLKSILLVRDGRLLLLLCTWNAEDAVVSVALDLAAAGLDSDLQYQLRNAETGELLAHEAGTFSLEMPSYAVRYLVLEPEAAP